MLNETFQLIEFTKAYAPLSPFAWPVSWAIGMYLLTVGLVISVLIVSLKEIILKLLDKLLAEGIFGREKVK